ncbi:hypothetical protein BpHYR1_027647 [Brachionus plicatilis]|uniref:Uncharacterized protein n=1 Tax=Brachionus plicatilis TaxID=10195 RepID=A0A3M7S386_BRAPC|nr:hypothetical protein BpHYR1_027647 [Brachionus plicatilis]
MNHSPHELYLNNKFHMLRGYKYPVRAIVNRAVFRQIKSPCFFKKRKISKLDRVEKDPSACRLYPERNIGSSSIIINMVSKNGMHLSQNSCIPIKIRTFKKKIKKLEADDTLITDINFNFKIYYSVLEDNFILH